MTLASSDRAALIRREMLVSAVINGILSVVFFSLASGLGPAVSLGAFGRDFLPQSFMVALMGAAVPGLIATRRAGSGHLRALRRAVLIALAAVLPGAALWRLCAASPGYLPLGFALGLKALYGVLLGALATPIQLTALLAVAS